MTYRFPFVALFVLCSLALNAQAGDYASNPQRDESAGVAHESDAAAQRRKAALRAALLEQQAQERQNQAATADVARPWTAQDRAELRQQIRQQNRSNSRP
jgi:uncharacterized protein (DUF1501 family)